MHTKVGLCEIYGYSVTAVQGVPKRDTGCHKMNAIGGRFGSTIAWSVDLNVDTYQGGVCEIYGYSMTDVPKRDTGCPKGIAIGGRYGFAIVWVGNLNLDTFQGRCDKWT